MIELLLMLAAFFTLSPGHAGTVERVAVDDGGIRIDFSTPVGEAARFALAGPDRIAIDIAGTAQSRFPADSGARIARVRQGDLGGGNLRLVLDLAQPMVVTDMRFAPGGRSLLLTTRMADATDFARFVASGRASVQAGIAGLPTLAMGERAQRRYQVSVPIGAPRNGVPLPRIHGPNDRALPLVVIDAGHGGHDPGALSPDGRFREEDLTLAMARAARDALVATGRVRVALTRDSDRFLVLQERYELARRLGANLFISIHADAAATPGAHGAAIYTLSETASDREAARLAARENRANIVAGVDLGGQSADVRSILIDLTQRETMNLSADFARTLQQMAGDDIPFRTGALRHAGFMVLKAPDMPSILLETGFITTPEDAERLASTAGQQAIGRGLRDGVLRHFARQIAAREAMIGAGTRVAAR